MVPLRIVSENIGSQVSFDPLSKEIMLVKGFIEADPLYTDGDYTTIGQYGGLPSSITVTVTLENSNITSVSVTPHATNSISLDLQRQFAAAVPDVVVGKRIDEVNVGRLAVPQRVQSSPSKDYERGSDGWDFPALMPE